VIQYLVGLKEEGDIIIPRSAVGVHPTHALYSKRCLPAMEQMVMTRQLRIRDLLTAGDIRVRYVDISELKDADPEGYSFFNVNTPKELEDAKRIASHREAGAS
jgi:molybdopterin-guanine dinucleotide biosynthesis protein A